MMDYDFLNALEVGLHQQAVWELVLTDL